MRACGFPLLAALALGCALPAAGAGAAEAPASRQIVAAASREVQWDGKVLGGAGAQQLLSDAAAAQFVIVIESHNDRATPLIAADLFGKLHEAHGYRYLAIEQDPLGMAAASSPPLRGDQSAIAAHACRYPFSFTFATDEEFTLLAEAGRISAAAQPIWGVDQLFGARAALDELAALADGPARKLALALRAEARRMEARREPAGPHFLSGQAVALAGRLAELHRLMEPAPGSRAAKLLEALQASAEIYAYYIRARELDATGAPLGLRNNWVREDWMKQRFLRHYRTAQGAGEERPRVLVKAGYWHAVRGLGPGNVFTLGTFLHEFAIANGAKALTIQVLPLREWWPTHDSIDPAFRVLLSPDAMTRTTLVDLRPLRQHLHMGASFDLGEADLRQFREMVFGVDYALFVPSAPGTPALARCPGP